MGDDARMLMCDQLKAVGFIEVTMLSKASEPLMRLSPARGAGGCLRPAFASVFCKTCLQ
jgi:hypothetical protein